MEEKNLYLVEFGEGVQQSGTMRFGGPAVEPIYVVAPDYNKAAAKANYYLETKVEELEVDKSKEVLTGDGSLNFNPPQKERPLKIVAVKHISEIIW